MSANPDGGDYYNKDQVKELCTIKAESTKNDDVLDQLGEDSNRYVGDLLFKYSADSDDLTDANQASATNIANYRTTKLWKLKQADYEGVREWKIAQKDAEKALISRLESDVTNTKSAPVAVSTSYRTAPLKNSN
jgi:hypothetical protein